MVESLDVIGKLITTIAIVIGGVWAYFKYIKGRLFHPRLELHIDGKFVIQGSIPHLLLNYEIKNIGLSKVDLNKGSSGIRILKYNPPGDSLEIESADWKHIGSFPVLEKHSWVESNEVIKESSLYSITDADNIVYRADLRIVGKEKSWETLGIIFITQ
jgi:hypothetical protein